MLEISAEAEQAIRGILASDGIPDNAVVRISVEEEAGPEQQSGFAVSVTESAPPEDQIVAGEEVEIAVEPAAAEMLDDKQLDASVSEGRVQFSLSEQAA